MKLDFDLSRRVALGLFAGSTLALSAAAAPAAPGKDIAALEASVKSLIGDAACTAHDQCRTIAFGAKACGGPQAYLPWSTLRTNEAALKRAADSYAEARRAEAKQLDMASNCAMVLDPGAYCSAEPQSSAAAAGPSARVCLLRSNRPAGGRSGIAN